MNPNLSMFAQMMGDPSQSKTGTPAPMPNPGPAAPPPIAGGPPVNGSGGPSSIPMAMPMPSATPPSPAPQTAPQGPGPQMAAQGRNGDTMIAHVTPGEIMVPPVLQTPKVVAAVHAAMRERGVDNPGEFVAGSPANKINPATGQPEFNGFLSKILPIAAAVVGTIYGGPAGGAAAYGITAKLTGASNKQALIGAGMTFLGGEFFGTASSAVGDSGGASSLFDGIFGPSASDAASLTASQAAAQTEDQAIGQGLMSNAGPELGATISNTGAPTAASLAEADDAAIGKGLTDTAAKNSSIFDGAKSFVKNNPGLTVAGGLAGVSALTSSSPQPLNMNVNNGPGLPKNPQLSNYIGGGTPQQFDFNLGQADQYGYGPQHNFLPLQPLPMPPSPTNNPMNLQQG